MWQSGAVLFLPLKMSQSSIDDVLVLNAAVRRIDDDLYRSTATTANLDIDIEYAFESLRPGHCRMTFGRCADFCVGDGLDAFPAPGRL